MFVICQDCDLEHAAEYSHESPTQGAIYAVVCTSTVDWLTDYYTTELLYKTSKVPADPIARFQNAPQEVLYDFHENTLTRIQRVKIVRNYLGCSLAVARDVTAFLA